MRHHRNRNGLVERVWLIAMLCYGLCGCIEPWDDPDVERRVADQLEDRYGGEFRDVDVIKPLGGLPLFPIGPALRTPFEAAGGPLEVEYFKGEVNMRWPHALGHTTYHCAALKEHIVKTLRATHPGLPAPWYVVAVCIGDDVKLNPRPEGLLGTDVYSLNLRVDPRGLSDEEAEAARARWRSALEGHGVGWVTVK